MWLVGQESYKSQISGEQKCILLRARVRGHWWVPPRPPIHSAHTYLVPALRMLRGPANTSLRTYFVREYLSLLLPGFEPLRG